MQALFDWLRLRLMLYTFSTRLIAGLLLIVILSAGAISAPAQLLTRRQLQAQAWAMVGSGQAVTESLVVTELRRLTNSADLLSERPTFLMLWRDGTSAQLRDYLEAFRQQSGLDFIALCAPDAELAVGVFAPAQVCDAGGAVGAQLLAGVPVLLVRESLADPLPATLLAGRALDAALIEALPPASGLLQTIVGADGTRYVGALRAAQPTDLRPLARDGTTAAAAEPHELWLDGRRYFATYVSLPGAAGLRNEIALAVDALVAAERATLLLQGGSTLLAALLAVLVGAFSIRQLVAPLRRLTLVAESISDGDLMTPIPLFSGPKEVSTLATAFHRSQASMLRALEERSQARDWLNALIQSIVEGVVTVDAAGIITFFSQGAELLSGHSAAEALGRPFDAVFAPRAAGAEAEVDALRLPAPGARVQIAVTLAGGRPAVLAVTAAHLPATSSVPAQTAFVLRDVTQEAALRDLRGYFLANISHEFRTPLSTLQAALEMLLDEQEALSASEMRELLRPSYLSLVSLRTLIDNLLESSRIEAGRFAIRPHPCDLARVLTDGVAIVRPLLDRRRQSLDITRPPALPQLEADAARLTQVLVNLLTNASKYSPQGSAIALTIAVEDGMLAIGVDDQGPGIVPGERAALFGRFVQLDSGDREQYGVGLGLYVVRTVIEAHGGRVAVDDRPGGGARFRVELPLPANVEQRA